MANSSQYQAQIERPWGSSDLTEAGSKNILLSILKMSLANTQYLSRFLCGGQPLLKSIIVNARTDIWQKMLLELHQKIYQKQGKKFCLYRKRASLFRNHKQFLLGGVNAGRASGASRDRKTISYKKSMKSEHSYTRDSCYLPWNEITILSMALIDFV